MIANFNNKNIYRLLGIWLVFSLLACGSNNDISGSYMADFDSILDPKMRQSYQLFKGYRIKAILTINDKDATMKITGLGVKSDGKLTVKRVDKSVILIAEGDREVARFIAQGQDTIKCIKCPDQKTPVLWRRINHQ